MSQSLVSPDFRIVDGRLVPPSHCELIVADHCNIACRACNHGSPRVSKWNLTPEDAERDLARLAPVYHVKELRIIGGEPTLNPRLDEILRVARQSGIADRIRMVTNGAMLEKLSEEGWALLDEVEISRYPGVELDPAKLDQIRARARKVGTSLIESTYTHFRATYISTRTDDDFAEKIFRQCKIGSVWACHGIYRGQLYKCPQSIYAPDLTGRERVDGFDFHAPDDLYTALHDHLMNHVRLDSCHNCLGTAGKKLEHSQIKRSEWMRDAEGDPAEMVDPYCFDTPLALQSRQDDCRIPLGAPPSRIRRLRSFVTRLLSA